MLRGEVVAEDLLCLVEHRWMKEPVEQLALSVLLYQLAKALAAEVATVWLQAATLSEDWL